MKENYKNYMKRMSDFKFKNVLFFTGIVLAIYLVAGLMLETIQESHARTEHVIEEIK